ncbi:MAG: tetratricopeptide repeat protein [Xanthomonadales bacterium]|nr:tetratricopeptide repeat protein [Xanthomonadales bacterium]
MIAVVSPKADKTEQLFSPSQARISGDAYIPAKVISQEQTTAAMVQEYHDKGFMESVLIGAKQCVRCHQDSVEQWSVSAHRFASFNNPFYRRTIEETRKKHGKKKSQFCGACHDPALLLSGIMLNDINPASAEAQAGLTCIACHGIATIDGRRGNGNYLFSTSASPYLFSDTESSSLQLLHDYLLRAKPQAHKAQQLKPFFRQSEFCLTCHKVSLDRDVNDYRWLRGQNEYDSWHNSGHAHNQPMTWYEPNNARQCQDCHMPFEQADMDVSAKSGKVRSHRFLAANTALPFLRRDNTSVRAIEKFMQNDTLRTKIFAIHIPGRHLITDFTSVDLSQLAGESIQVDIIVRNLNVGHAFPGGTNDSNQAWLKFTVYADDKLLYSSGGLNSDGFVDPGAHFYNTLLIDRNAKRIAHRNVLDIHTVVYNNVIGPGSVDIVRYSFTVPVLSPGTALSFQAELLWRKFNQTFTDFVFTDKLNFPVTKITSDTVDSSTPHKNNPLAWQDYNDYGIGSYLDGDMHAALWAFKYVTQLVPEKMEGYLNQARVYLTQGNFLETEKQMRLASQKGPGNARVVFFWGLLFEKLGKTNDAIDAYRYTLQTYPDSRDVWFRLGRSYWLSDHLQEAVTAYKKVLDIDPENQQAHYQLIFVYQLLAEKTPSSNEKHEYLQKAQLSTKMYEKYKPDENAQELVYQYRRKHPHANLMSQKLIVHTLVNKTL